MSTPLNWLAAALLCLILGSANLLDGPDDHSFEVAQAQELEALQRAEGARLRYEQTAQRICGANTGWVELPDGTRRCTDKRGRPSDVYLLAGAHP